MSKIRYAVYNDATGRIMRVGTCLGTELASQPGVGESAQVSVGVSDATDYYSGSPKAVTPRPVSSITIDKLAITTQPPADADSKATVTNIPNPSDAWITDGNGQSVLTITDGELIIVSDVADNISVEIDGTFPELKFEAVVVAS